MNSLTNSVGGYVAEVQAAVSRAGWLSVLLLLPGLLVVPFAVQSILHPLDVVKLDHLLHGLPMPHSAMGRQLSVALAEVAVVMALVFMWQLIVTVSFYRKAQIFGRRVAAPRLWPLSLLGIGGLGNLAWFMGLGDAVDTTGFIIGLTSAGASILIEMICETLGRDFVVGTPSGFHPPIQ